MNIMNIKLTLSAAVVGAVVLAAVPNSSAISNIGEPFPGHSWGQAWYENGVGYFDAIGIKWLSGSALEAPQVLTALSGGWNQTYAAGDVAWARGSATTLEYFSTIFVGGSSDFNSSYLFNAYNGDKMVDSAVITHAGGSWTITSSSESFGPPLPDGGTTMALLGMALCGLGYARRFVK